MCIVPGCPKAATATIYCQMHYRRFRLYGDVNKVLRKQRRQCDTTKVVYHEDYAEIELTQDKWALVSLEDIEKVVKYKWHFSSTSGYAYSRAMSMQELLIGCAPFGMEIDHGNRNRIDNRRANIAIVTKSENCQNTEKFKNTTRIFFHSASGKYQAYIWHWNMSVYLGVYVTREIAAIAQKNAMDIVYNYDSVFNFKKDWKLMRKRKTDTEKRDE